MEAERRGVMIVDEAVVYGLEFLFFVEYVRQHRSDRSVTHDDDDVLSVFREREFGLGCRRSLCFKIALVDLADVRETEHTEDQRDGEAYDRRGIFSEAQDKEAYSHTAERYEKADEDILHGERRLIRIDQEIRDKSEIVAEEL